MFTTKELRGNNSMLGRVQRQQDCSYSEKLKLIENDNLNSEDGFKFRKGFVKKEFMPMKEIKRIMTKAELGNKRRMLR